MVNNGSNLGLTLSPLSGVGGGLFPCLLPDVYLPLLDAGDVLLPCPWPGAGGVLAVYPLPGVGGVGMIVSCCFVGQITTNLSKNFHSFFLFQISPIARLVVLTEGPFSKRKMLIPSGQQRFMSVLNSDQDKERVEPPNVPPKYCSGKSLLLSCAGDPKNWVR